MNKILPVSILPKGENICRRCAEEGPTCCRSAPEYSAESFPLSTAEWERLHEYIHLATPCPPAPDERKGPQDTTRPLPGSDLVEGDAARAAEENSPEFVDAIASIFPGEKNVVLSLFPVSGTHWRLRTGPDGACVFLGDDGCRLPRQARPWYCRIYPAWISAGGLSLFVSDTCLIAQSASTPQDGLALLGISFGDVRELYTSLRRDWGFPARG